jgi:gamma-glutamylcyclotransferase (GGCT)/AIG2-like uncharacterized protein YtfP
MKRDYIFVYGLFRDQAKKLLGETTFCGKASVVGKLYKVNEFYPGFVPDSGGKVWGDIYLFNPELLPQMDEYEGDEYIRTKIMTSSDIECWIYQYQLDTKGFEQIISGDWYLR